MSAAPLVEFEARGHIAIISFNRPEQRNAVNAGVATAMEAAIKRFEADDELWVGVLTGKGKVFCAGADLKALGSGLETPEGGFAGLVRRKRSKPLIAAVDGPALAGGLEVALSCDMIVASEAAQFGLPEVKRSLVAAAGGVFRLPRRVPYQVAMEMVLTGDPIPVQRAYTLGLVNEVVPAGKALEAAIKLAERIIENAPLAVRESRAIVVEAPYITEETGWKMSKQAFSNVANSPDFFEGPRAFAEKRKPKWTGKAKL
eukprot:TRINITY_DN4460_c0_g1_i1.p2 TRINITY_DN4460_c0_g1~~TRINITY_DN4460_c0_g1_i1.p2  ORF type:complete len:267 (-),score=54.13 TRINITY_DN4460_c0_g1_i1:73-846(-)